jgi:hypothetical protein
MLNKEMLCDRCLAHFDHMMSIGRPADMEFCKKCVAKIDRLVEEGLKNFRAVADVETQDDQD